MSWDLYIRAVLYLLLVLGLVLVCTWLVRVYGGARLSSRGSKRLQLTETLAIDPRRRLVTIKWDDQEHLVLLAGTGDVLIASKTAAPQIPGTRNFSDQLPEDLR